MTTQNLIETTRSAIEEWSGWPDDALSDCESREDLVEVVSRASSHLYGDPTESYAARASDEAAARDVQSARAHEINAVAYAHLCEVERERANAAQREALAILAEVEAALAEGNREEALDAAERLCTCERTYGGDDPDTSDLRDAIDATPEENA